MRPRSIAVVNDARMAREDTEVIENKRTRFLIRMLSAMLAVALLAGGLGTGPTVTAKSRKGATPRLVRGFSNTGAIAIPDGSQAAPSQIVVSGFQTQVADVDLTLHNLNHGQVGDVDVLLVGPGGQSALVLSDVGSSANNVTLTLDDQAANQVSSTAILSSGTFQPTNFQSATDLFGPPAPQPTRSGSELGVFNSTDPNGIWTLYVRDDAFGAVGILSSGFSLNITSANGVPNAAPESFSTQAGQTLIDGGGVLANDNDPDGDLLTAVLAGRPTKGEVTLEPDGSFTYRSSKKAKGTDSFTYLAQDPTGLSDLETVTIQIQKAKKKKKGKK
jgi:subtilisin-like proprotein convertase family protein